MRFVRRFARLLAIVGSAAFPVEAFAAALLFRLYARRQRALWPAGSATLFLLRKVLRRDPPPVFACDPPYLFRPDPVLGYAAIPGRYRITARANGQVYESHVTIREDGLRAASYRRIVAQRRFHLFGDSFVWGNGLEDEHTIPWLLQACLPDYEVVNQALNGYTAVHQLLQWRALRDRLQPDDIVFFSYLRDELRFNIGEPLALRAREHGFEVDHSDPAIFTDAQFPFAALTEDGALVIRRHPLSGSRGGKARAADAVDPRSRVPVTIRIFDEIVRGSTCQVLIGFFSGDDDDPVIAHLRSAGAMVADLRIAQGTSTAEDFLYDRLHRGALSHHRFYAIIRDKLIENGLLDAGTALHRLPAPGQRLSYKTMS